MTLHQITSVPRRAPRPSRGLAPILAVALLFAPSAWADDVGDPVAGRKLAQAWCSNCHVFQGSDRATATGAPSFTAIASIKTMTPSALRGFLQTPHARMPDLHLSNSEMDDLIAFILSSRPR